MNTSAALETGSVQEREVYVWERLHQLEAANAELEAFASAVSHDLRSPVRAVRCFASLLKENYKPVLEGEGLQWVQKIEKAAVRMDALTSDLLTLSHSRRMSMVHEPVDLSALVREIVQDLKDQEPERQVRITIAEAVIAFCDSRMVHIALENLLSNAWKFSSRQSAARIEFGARAGPPEVYFVRDNGAGFEPEWSHRLFTPFERLHSQNEFPGTGVGLTTVKRVVERHGGAIWAESELGRGATFYFTLTDRTES